MSHTLINCTCKIDLVSLYFRLLWYHSILRGSIDKKKRWNKRNLKTKHWNWSTQPSLVLISLHDFLIFSNRTVHAWSVEAGNICSVSVFFIRVGSQISPRRAKKDSNIPSPGVGHLTDLVLPGEGIFESFFARHGDIWLPTRTKKTETEHMFPGSTLHACAVRFEKIRKSWRPMTTSEGWVDFTVLSSNFVCFSVFLINWTS